MFPSGQQQQQKKEEDGGSSRRRRTAAAVAKEGGRPQKQGSFWTAVKAARVARGNLSWGQYIRRSKVPELPVVLLEDLGALLGLVIALLGVGLALVTGDPRFDAIGSLAIGGLLAVIAIVLAAEMRSLLLGESASKETLDDLRDDFDVSPLVQKVDVVDVADRDADHLRDVVPNRICDRVHRHFRVKEVELSNLVSGPAQGSRDHAHPEGVDEVGRAGGIRRDLQDPH